MKLSVTPRQHDLLAFIKRYLAENDGVAPSLDEMKDALGLASKANIHGMLVNLEQRGLIVRTYAKARAIEIVQDPDPTALASFSSKALLDELARRGEANRRAA